jgi:hypothetical protein
MLEKGRKISGLPDKNPDERSVLNPNSPPPQIRFKEAYVSTG